MVVKDLMVHDPKGSIVCRNIDTMFNFLLVEEFWTLKDIMVYLQDASIITSASLDIERSFEFDKSVRIHRLVARLLLGTTVMSTMFSSMDNFSVPGSVKRDIEALDLTLTTKEVTQQMLANWQKLANVSKARLEGLVDTLLFYVNNSNYIGGIDLLTAVAAEAYDGGVVTLEDSTTAMIRKAFPSKAINPLSLIQLTMRTLHTLETYIPFLEWVASIELTDPARYGLELEELARSLNAACYDRKLFENSLSSVIFDLKHQRLHQLYQVFQVNKFQIRQDENTLATLFDVLHHYGEMFPTFDATILGLYLKDVLATNLSNVIPELYFSDGIRPVDEYMHTKAQFIRLDKYQNDYTNKTIPDFAIHDLMIALEYLRYSMEPPSRGNPGSGNMPNGSTSIPKPESLSYLRTDILFTREIEIKSAYDYITKFYKGLRDIRIIKSIFSPAVMTALGSHVHPKLATEIEVPITDDITNQMLTVIYTGVNTVVGAHHDVINQLTKIVAETFTMFSEKDIKYMTANSPATPLNFDYYNIGLKRYLEMTSKGADLPIFGTSEEKDRFVVPTGITTSGLQQFLVPSNIPGNVPKIRYKFDPRIGEETATILTRYVQVLDAYPQEVFVSTDSNPRSAFLANVISPLEFEFFKAIGEFVSRYSNIIESHSPALISMMKNQQSILYDKVFNGLIGSMVKTGDITYLPPNPSRKGVTFKTSIGFDDLCLQLNEGGESVYVTPHIMTTIATNFRREWDIGVYDSKKQFIAVVDNDTEFKALLKDLDIQHEISFDLTGMAIRDGYTVIDKSRQGKLNRQFVYYEKERLPLSFSENELLRNSKRNQLSYYVPAIQFSKNATSIRSDYDLFPGQSLFQTEFTRMGVPHHFINWLIKIYDGIDLRSDYLLFLSALEQFERSQDPKDEARLNIRRERIIRELEYELNLPLGLHMNVINYLDKTYLHHLLMPEIKPGNSSVLDLADRGVAKFNLRAPIITPMKSFENFGDCDIIRSPQLITSLYKWDVQYRAKNDLSRQLSSFGALITHLSITNAKMFYLEGPLMDKLEPILDVGARFQESWINVSDYPSNLSSNEDLTTESTREEQQITQEAQNLTLEEKKSIVDDEKNDDNEIV